jgi:hypothetical protein
MLVDSDRRYFRLRAGRSGRTAPGCGSSVLGFIRLELGVRVRVRLRTGLTSTPDPNQGVEPLTTWRRWWDWHR